MFDRIEFILGEAFSALRRNTWMTFAAVTTAAIALFLLGGMTMAYLSVSRYANSLSDRLVMRVFVKEGIPRPQVEATAQTMRQIPGVKKVVLIPREAAWKKKQAEMPEITAGLENPLPDAFNVTLSDLKSAPTVATELEKLPVVEKVNRLSEVQDLLASIIALIRGLGLGLGGLMLVTSAVLIYNAIRLTIVARWREMKIMRLVGATRATIITPMLLEGMIQGALGGALALGVLWGAYSGLGRLVTSLAALGSWPAFPAGTALGILMATGAAYGLLCSLLAVREPRRQGNR